MFNFTVGFVLALMVITAGINLAPIPPSEGFILQAVILPPSTPSTSVEVCQNSDQVRITNMNNSTANKTMNQCLNIDVLSPKINVENISVEDLPRIPTLQKI
jgi:hypothetical protein